MDTTNTNATNAADFPTVPEDQRAALLICYWRDLDYALGWAQHAETNAEKLARLTYLQISAERLRRAITAYGVDPATDRG